MMFHSDIFQALMCLAHQPFSALFTAARTLAGLLVHLNCWQWRIVPLPRRPRLGPGNPRAHTTEFQHRRALCWWCRWHGLRKLTMWQISCKLPTQHLLHPSRACTMCICWIESFLMSQLVVAHCSSDILPESIICGDLLKECLFCLRHYVNGGIMSIFLLPGPLRHLIDVTDALE